MKTNKMKYILTFAICLFFSVTWSQKKELRSAKKLLADSLYSETKDFLIKKQAYTGSGKIINSKFLDGLKAPKDSVIYVWGAVVSKGNFIVDLDNPWSLTGYNLTAMSLYRPILLNTH